MKTFKKIALAFLASIVLSSVGGYFYFDKKFTPPDNYLKVAGNTENISITWISSGQNQHAALLLPVQIKGIKKTFYMQLDFGSPITMLYKNSLQDVQKVYSKEIPLHEKDESIAMNFQIENMSISSDKFKVIDFGQKMNMESPDAINIIGTIGTDLLEKRLIVLDFITSTCTFSEGTIPNGFAEFEFKKRKILLPGKIGNEDLKLLYDSGTSGYQLITNKSEWTRYKTQNGKIKTEKGNSWGNTLKVMSAPANQRMEIGTKQLPLSEVTYIEGISSVQRFLMKSSGMQGMIGNKLFIGHKITLDCKNEKFKVE